MFGLSEIYSALNVTAITNLLSVYGSGKALFNDIIIPENFTGTDSINFYLESPHNGALEYNEYAISINCRSSSYNKSLTLAQTVFNTINREHITDGFIVCSVLKTIPPADTTDVFNTPVSVKLKMR